MKIYPSFTTCADKHLIGIKLSLVLSAWLGELRKQRQAKQITDNQLTWFVQLRRSLGLGRSVHYFSQWSSQFYVAAELTRRGYIVSFTMGNAPKTDLLVESPEGDTFRIQCKGQFNKSAWLTGEVRDIKDLYYTFVYVSKNVQEPPRFFIMAAKDVKVMVQKEKERAARENLKPFSAGLLWKMPHPYEGRWDLLPA
ncbi:MAG: hypothetical protein AM326_01955 [Candidatus Thorarchaeota archaeon SMTZ-45]|nr:MAG: hypothetical protein AM326_01955 [Candidatus Thorarchaeota archaeon SMTZ-45]